MEPRKSTFPQLFAFLAAAWDFVMLWATAIAICFALFVVGVVLLIVVLAIDLTLNPL